MSKTVYKIVLENDEPLLRLSCETDILDLKDETTREDLMEFIERCGKLVKPLVEVINGRKYSYNQRHRIDLMKTTYLFVYVEKIVINQKKETFSEKTWMTIEGFYEYFGKFILINSTKFQRYLYENFKKEANQAKNHISWIVKKMIGSFKNQYEYRLDLKYTRSRDECGWMASFLWYTNILIPKNISEVSELIFEILGENYELFLAENS